MMPYFMYLYLTIGHRHLSHPIWIFKIPKDGIHGTNVASRVLSVIAKRDYTLNEQMVLALMFVVGKLVGILSPPKEVHHHHNKGIFLFFIYNTWMCWHEFQSGYYNFKSLSTHAWWKAPPGLCLSNILTHSFYEMRSKSKTLLSIPSWATKTNRECTFIILEWSLQ